MKLKTPRSAVVTLALSAVLLSNAQVRASETDDRIEASAKNSYVYKTFLKDDDIKTESKDGTVTLSGKVADYLHKALAQQTVEGLPGVVKVNNQIVLKDAPVEHSDTWLYVKVKSTLAFHRSVSAYNTQVEVKEGVAILKGEASSMAQKELASEYVSDVEGIKSVNNQMTVAATTSAPLPVESFSDLIDDASITAQVRLALLSHRSTSAFTTLVTTENSVVTIGGKAKNAAEIALITKLVSDINGVKSVVNNMTIEVAELTK